MNGLRHDSLWKKGNQNYHFHTPIEYEILRKGSEEIIQKNFYLKVAKNHILIKPISIHESKTKKVIVGKQEIVLSDYSFWIPRRMIRRGRGSFKIKEDRWVHKETFYHCLSRAVNGDRFYQYIGNYWF